MKTRLILVMTLMIATLIPALSQDITLPKPQTKGGIPLMEALSKRSSHREFSSKEIDNQKLSNLLWAAWGYNRSDKRTAPSSRNKQELEIYVVKKSGAYIYDARNNSLKQISNADVRKSTGKQEYVWSAPLNIVYVADQSKGASLDESRTNCGFIAQNVYLYCASEGLGTVVRGFFDAKELSEALKLKPTQVPILSQTVGYKK